jgi:serine/threonine protein kinase
MAGQGNGRKTRDEWGGAAVAATTTSPLRSRRLGEVVAGSYRLMAHLGSGGMGDVYEVEHLRLGRLFAAKFLRADLAEEAGAVARFRREAQAMALVRSDHVASIVDLGEDTSGVPFLVMERLYGCDLRELLRRHETLTVPRAVRLMVDAALGLRTLHRAGLVHGDVKPANLFVCMNDRGGDVCKVLDFGLTRASAPRESPRRCEAGSIRYMAPEQLSDRGDMDHRTDIYGLGVVLYECLSGRPPHTTDRTERLLYAKMHEAPSPLRALGIVLPKALDGVIARALATDPDERFENVDELISAISSFAGAPAPTRFARARSNSDETTPEVPIVLGKRPVFWQFRILPFASGAFVGAAAAFFLTRPSAPASTLGRSAPTATPPTAGAVSFQPARPLASGSAPSVAAGVSIGEVPNRARSRTLSLRPAKGKSRPAPSDQPGSVVLGTFDDDSPYRRDR